MHDRLVAVHLEVELLEVGREGVGVEQGHPEVLAGAKPFREFQHLKYVKGLIIISLTYLLINLFFYI